MASAGIAGSVVSGILVAGVGAGWALAIDATTFAVSAFFLAQLRLPAQITLPPQSFLSDLRDGWNEFSSRTWVWVIVVAASLGNIVTSIWIVLGAQISKTTLGGPRAWALILAALGVGSLAGGFVALRVRVRHPLYFGGSLLVFLGLPISLLALHAPAAVVASGALLAGAGNMIFNSLWETALQRHIPPEALSRVSAYDWFGSLAFAPLGYVIAGPAAVAIGASATLWIAAGAIVVMTAAVVATPSVRRLEMYPDDAAHAQSVIGDAAAAERSSASSTRA
jgi:hypothetical protein